MRTWRRGALQGWDQGARRRAVTGLPFDGLNDGHIMVEGPVWKADDMRS